MYWLKSNQAGTRKKMANCQIKSELIHIIYENLIQAMILMEGKVTPSTLLTRHPCGLFHKLSLRSHSTRSQAHLACHPSSLFHSSSVHSYTTQPYV